MISHTPITLEKLYLDCVDAQGNAWIGCSLKVQWFWLTLHLHQSLVSKNGALEIHFARTKTAPEIQLDPDVLNYACQLFEVRSKP